MYVRGSYMVEIWSPQVGIWKWGVRYSSSGTYRVKGSAWSRRGAIRAGRRKRRSMERRDEREKEEMTRTRRTLERVDC